jgi:methylated-DNA-[protein]-cysteine S-methyltransferase
MTAAGSTLYLATPIGTLELESAGDALIAVRLPASTGAPDRRNGHGAPREADPAPVLRDAARQLGEYFDGRRTEFTVPVHLDGTAFQRSVWAELRRIPYGETISYGELARRVGRPRGPRAVGQANAHNPVAIIVPCHRVVAADGIGGYAGGLATKRHLLAIEGITG